VSAGGGGRRGAVIALAAAVLPACVSAGGAVDTLPAVAHTIHARYAPVRRDVAGAMARAVRRACPGDVPRALVLAVDATGSMGRSLDAIKDAAAPLAAAAARGCRLAVFAYRDVGSGFTVKLVADFLVPPETALADLGSLEAREGGDDPELVWSALDAATAMAEDSGLPAHVLLVGDAAAHADPRKAERVRARLASGRITVEILEVTHGRPVTPPPRDLDPAALATLFAGRYLAVPPDEAAEALARELRAAAGATPAPPEVALVLGAGHPRGIVRALAEVAAPARALEAAGGDVALVRVGDPGDGSEAVVLAALHAPGVAAGVLADAAARVAGDADPPGPAGLLAGLAAAAALPWTPGRTHAIVLVAEDATDRDPPLEAPLRAFLAAPGAILIVLEPRAEASHVADRPLLGPEPAP